MNQPLRGSRRLNSSLLIRVGIVVVGIVLGISLKYVLPALGVEQPTQGFGTAVEESLK